MRQKRFSESFFFDAAYVTLDIKALFDLYDRQISKLEKSNDMKKQKLLKYRRKMKKSN